MMMKKLFIILSVVVISQMRLVAQEDDLIFSILSNVDGASLYNIQTIYQDSIGFLWFGTGDGLYRYDGYSISKYRAALGRNKGLSHNSINSICESGKGVFWIGTNGGLTRYDSKNDTYYRIFSFTQPDKEHAEEIKCTYYHNNRLYIGTQKGLFIGKETPDSIIIEEFKNKGTKEKEDFAVYSFICISDTVILASTSIGVLNIQENNLTYKKQDISINGEIFTGVIFNAFKDAMERLWLITDIGICISNNKIINNIYTGYGIIKARTIPSINEKWDKLGRVQISSLLEIDDGIFWLSTMGNGILTYNQYTDEADQISYQEQEGALNNDFVYSTIKDKSGIIWVGTDGGANYIDPFKTKFTCIKSDPFNNEGSDFRHLHAIFDGGDGKIWIGTKSSGLFIIDMINKVTLHYMNDKVIDNSQVRAIIKDNKGAIWIGTGNGIRILESDQQIIRKVGDPILLGNIVYAFAEDNEGNIWIGTDNGIYIYERLSGDIIDFSSSESGNMFKGITIYSLKLDSLGRIWVGTLDGPNGVIYRQDISDKIVTLSNPAEAYLFASLKISSENGDQLGRFSCFCIQETSNNQIWLGTNWGLYPANRANFEVMGLDNSSEYPTGMIYGILEDSNGYIWLSTNNGIVKYDPVNNNSVSFTTNDNLQSMEFNGGASFSNPDGTIYFGGPEGLNLFNPQDILKQNSYNSPIVISKLFINGEEILPRDEKKILKKSILYTDRISVKKIQNSIGFEFASLHLGSPGDNQFEYNMSKKGGEWTSINNQNFVNFTNLSRGVYTFMVRGTNNDGKWSDEIKTLTFIVKPAWYESIPAITIYVTLIFAFFLFLRRNTLKRIELEQAVEIEKFEKSKSIELNEAKLKFFTNISHEFRTPLSLILAPISSLVKDYNTDPKLSDYLSIIDKNAKRLSRLVNQVLDFRKVSNDSLSLRPVEGNICESVKSISSHFDIIIDQRNIDFNIECQEEEIIVTYDEDKFEKTLINLISNALSVVNDFGKISIEVRKEIIATKESLNEYYIVGDLNEYLLNNGYVEIKVTDNGSGMKPSVAKRIFDEFYQGDSAISGTGIGLYLVKQFTLLHKGLILLKSQENFGTTFLIRYPLGDRHFSPEQLNLGKSEYSESLFDYQSLDESNHVIKSDIAEEDKSHTLLIIEDDYQMGHYLLKELSEYEVILSPDAKIGLDAAKENLPDLIISDIVLPGMNGLEFCKTIKNDILTSHIPVILLSAKAMETNILEGLETGADSYLTKPFNVDILKATIKNLIKSKEKLRKGILQISGFDFNDTNISSVDELFLNKLKNLIEVNLSNAEYNVEMLSSDLGMSRTHLFRKMKSLTGQTYITFIRTLRLQKAARLLKTGKLTISEVAFSVGFSDPKYFSKTFKNEFGLSPTDYQSEP